MYAMGMMGTIAIGRAVSADSGNVIYTMTMNYNTTEMIKDTLGTRAIQTAHVLTVDENGIEKADGVIVENNPALKTTMGIETPAGINPTLKETDSFVTANPAITPYTGSCNGLPIETQSNATCYYASVWLNGTPKIIVPAEDFAQESFNGKQFAIPRTTYLTTQKTVIFNSAYNYISDYLGTNTNFAITNQFLNQSVDYAGLSSVADKFIGDRYGEYAIPKWNVTSGGYDTLGIQKNLIPTKAESILSSTGTKTQPITKVIGIDDLIALAIVAVIVFIWLGMPQVTKWITESNMAAVTYNTINQQTTVALAAINAEYNITMTMLHNKAVFENNTLAMLNNGTITYGEAMGLLGLVGGQYTGMINARATNIKDITDTYLNTTANEQNHYIDGAVAVANWSDSWSSFTIMLVLIIVIIVLYYVLVKRKSSSGSTINIMGAPAKK
jgi:hypothetical protein